MANQQHAAILKQGTQAWNTWRQQNPTVTPDLSKGNLRGADLSETDLSRADLSETDLSEANLSEANLSYIIAHSAPPPQELVFDWEYLVADLRNADLSNTNLSKCETAHLDEDTLLWYNDAVLYHSNTDTGEDIVHATSLPLSVRLGTTWGTASG